MGGLNNLLEVIGMKDYSKYINSTGTHYIANSGGDENKGTKGGQAGDQTGHEWELRSWYSRPWNVVLRYPDPAARKLFAEISCAAALNNHIGYDQNQRTTYVAQLEKAGWNPENITTDCEEDCTAGVTANWIAVGHLMNIQALKNLPKTIYSGNMRSYFEKAGFEALTDSKYLTGHDYNLTGDVLLYTNHHAAANITKGSKAVEQKPVEPAKPIENGVKVKNGTWNVRKGPGKEYASIGSVTGGTVLEVVNVDGWRFIQAGNLIGWVSNNALED